MSNICASFFDLIIDLTKITAAQNEVVLSYRKVRGLYFLAVAFAVIMDTFPCDIPEQTFLKESTN